jgi:ribosomal protein L33
MTYKPAKPRICSVCEEPFSRVGSGTKCTKCKGRLYRTTESYELRKHANRLARKKYVLKRLYNITQEQFNELLEAQDNRCAICSIHKDELDRRMSVDHDHGCCPGMETCGKCIRGLLCGVCNMSMGGFKDDVVLMNKAIDYLRQYEGVGSNY